MDKTKIARINALAKKAKTVGLNERETAERDALRKEYLAEMRASFKAQLASTYVQTADGAKIPYAEYARTAKETDTFWFSVVDEATEDLEAMLCIVPCLAAHGILLVFVS